MHKDNKKPKIVQRSTFNRNKAEKGYPPEASLMQKQGV